MQKSKMNVLHTAHGWIQAEVSSIVSDCKVSIESIIYSIDGVTYFEGPQCLSHPEEVVNDFLAMKALLNQ